MLFWRIEPNITQLVLIIIQMYKNKITLRSQKLPLKKLRKITQGY